MDNLHDRDRLFSYLQILYNTELFVRDFLIIFDEILECPKVRAAIKYLVADGRYDFIETGSLMSIRKNTKDIVISSEEESIDMFPMDFEEYLDEIQEYPKVRPTIRRGHNISAHLYDGLTIENLRNCCEKAQLSHP